MLLPWWSFPKSLGLSRVTPRNSTWIRNNSQTAYHPIGTCRMGPAGPTTVVDDKLKVHGLEGLRVADASVMPTMVSSNTNAPSFMIGERCADFILREAGSNRAGP